MLGEGGDVTVTSDRTGWHFVFRFTCFRTKSDVFTMSRTLRTMTNNLSIIYSFFVVIVVVVLRIIIIIAFYFCT